MNSKKKAIVAFALREEFAPIQLKGYEVNYVFTGIGKTKAAMSVTKAILEFDPDLVMNVGTSGTLNHRVGDIFVCKRFIDRDFHTVQLPNVEFEVGFEEKLEAVDLIREWSSSSGVTIGVCNTGDSFVTQAESVHGDVVDMEAFAEAIVCREFNKPFLAVKYVTDLIGENSVKHWADKLADARRDLEQWFCDK